MLILKESVMACNDHKLFKKYVSAMVVGGTIFGMMYQFHVWSKNMGSDEKELKTYKKTTEKLVEDIGEIKDSIDRIERHIFPSPYNKVKRVVNKNKHEGALDG